jgi:hypothetical protein
MGQRVWEPTWEGRRAGRANSHPGLAEQCTAPDCLQRPLGPRSRSSPRRSPGALGAKIIDDFDLKREDVMRYKVVL